MHLPFISKTICVLLTELGPWSFFIACTAGRPDHRPDPSTVKEGANPRARRLAAGGHRSTAGFRRHNGDEKD